MKKLIQASLVLFLFSISILLIQTSCSKITASPKSPTQVNKLLYYKYDATGFQIWTSNFDGTNAVRVPVTLPANTVINTNVDQKVLIISPDGQTIFFSVLDTSTSTVKSKLYSCDINGNNLTLVQDPPPGTGYIVTQAF